MSWIQISVQRLGHSMISAISRYTVSNIQNFNKVRKLITSLVKICTKFFLAIMRVHWDEGDRRELLDDDSDTDSGVGHTAVDQFPLGWSIQLTTYILNSNLYRTCQVIKSKSICFWTLVLYDFHLSLQTNTIIYTWNWAMSASFHILSVHCSPNIQYYIVWVVIWSALQRNMFDSSPHPLRFNQFICVCVCVCVCVCMRGCMCLCGGGGGVVFAGFFPPFIWIFFFFF